MNISDAQHNLCNNGELCVSIKSGSDVIIGQVCYLKVILSADQPILEKISHILIKDGTNSIQAINIDDWRINSDKTCGYATFQLQINHQLIADVPVNYTVHAVSLSGKDVQEITPKQVSYTAKKIASDSHIHLDYDKNYLITPITENSTKDPHNEYVVISSIIKDNKGNLLKNVGVTISAMSNKAINQVIFTTDGELPEEIPVETVKETQFITVYSDLNGNIKFRIYPKKDTAVRLELMTAILGVTRFTLEYALYIVTPSNGIGTLGYPIIRELDSDNCIRQNLRSSSKSFHVKIPKYSNYQDGDAILFFVQKKIGDKPTLLQPISTFQSEDSVGKRIFSFPYNSFPLKEEVGFYYVISPVDGQINYSYPISVTYLGGEEKNPKEQIYRQYDKVRVYDSTVDLPIDLSSNESLVDEYTPVNTASISFQKDYEHVDINKAVGLYVIVPASKYPNNKSLPTVGQSGGVDLYYTSDTRNNQKFYKFNLEKEGGNIVPIPYCALSRATNYNGEYGELFFDYYIDDGNGTKTYSHIWVAAIGTETNMRDDNLEGCSPDA
ncbi:hypothetical protein [Xenorhabdus sp. Sc-CR9]|uniref:hypothetical protein n=1 Tax=Xenorhabdus sp. Sc-CR9 TaxID=2584468 RepID=UPI001F305B77|nr:hypothetical protein [Xenorhabdus sp. Sc-CR9]